MEKQQIKYFNSDGTESIVEMDPKEAAQSAQGLLTIPEDVSFPEISENDRPYGPWQALMVLLIPVLVICATVITVTYMITTNDC